MLFAKRRLPATALALALASLSVPVPALAAGPGDPVARLALDVEKPAGGAPVMTFSLTPAEIEQFNALTGTERSDYLARIITRYLLDLGPEAEPDALRAMIAAQLGNNWCGACTRTGDTLAARIELESEGLAVAMQAGL